jgi:hypothetical protein
MYSENAEFTNEGLYFSELGDCLQHSNLVAIAGKSERGFEASDASANNHDIEIFHISLNLCSKEWNEVVNLNAGAKEE